MNSPVLQLPQVSVLVTRKTLTQAADKFMSNAVGVYSQDDVFNAVMSVVSAANRKMLDEETSWAIAREAIGRRSKPRLSNTEDWFGYGEMAIKLPESKIVNVYYAENEALDHRLKNVIDNRDRINKATDEEIARVQQIKAMMLKIGVLTAGPALEILQRGGTP
jgi:hypothetical protein